jgi:hypothetical protein
MTEHESARGKAGAKTSDEDDARNGAHTQDKTHATKPQAPSALEAEVLRLDAAVNGFLMDGWVRGNAEDGHEE